MSLQSPTGAHRCPRLQGLRRLRLSKWIAVKATVDSGALLCRLRPDVERWDRRGLLHQALAAKDLGRQILQLPRAGVHCRARHVVLLPAQALATDVRPAQGGVRSPVFARDVTISFAGLYQSHRLAPIAEANFGQTPRIGRAHCWHWPEIVPHLHGTMALQHGGLAIAGTGHDHLWTCGHCFPIRFVCGHDVTLPLRVIRTR
mmetsp:Transcript_95857/g.172935  ORF Transcript_95857/g.172935 Transcript_95857/m.172935 type:complete len:202 (-) Transcript_95857:230-835(-)